MTDIKCEKCGETSFEYKDEYGFVFVLHAERDDLGVECSDRREWYCRGCGEQVSKSVEAELTELFDSLISFSFGY